LQIKTTSVSKKSAAMNMLEITTYVLLAALLAGCHESTAVKSIESKGYFGKLSGIKAEYIYQDSILEAKSKTEANSVDDLVKIQSKRNLLKEKSKANFASEASKLNLPITISFLDSSGRDNYVIKNVKISKAEWDGITFITYIELKDSIVKLIAEKETELIVPALLLDEYNNVIKFGKYDTWLLMRSTGEIKAGSTSHVAGSLPVSPNIVNIKKILFKSTYDYNQSKGWN
jgi:hypothetical protein